jgi:hypothetical protein
MSLLWPTAPSFISATRASANKKKHAKKLYQIWINPGTLKYIFITSAENFSILTIPPDRNKEMNNKRDIEILI